MKRSGCYFSWNHKVSIHVASLWQIGSIFSATKIKHIAIDHYSTYWFLSMIYQQGVIKFSCIYGIYNSTYAHPWIKKQLKHAGVESSAAQGGHWSMGNSLWPSDAIWSHRSGSTLAQVMACCLTTPSHYLNQCWLISEVPWHLSEDHFRG